MIIEKDGPTLGSLPALQKLEDANAIQRLDQIELDINKRIILKFNFKNRTLIPRGIPIRYSFNAAEADRIQATVASSRGQALMAGVGRVRPGRVDTAKAMMEAHQPLQIPFVRVGLANNNFFPTWCCWYSKDAKAGAGRSQPGCVVDLRFHHRNNRTPEQEKFQLSRGSVEGLRVLSGMVWQSCYIYDNADTITVNLAGLLRDGMPKLATAVRNNHFVFLDLSKLEADEK